MPRRVWLLAAGALALAFAGGPLHSLDSASLPAHMAEHGVLLFVAPLLLALGYPILGRLRFRDAGPEWLAALVGLAFAQLDDAAAASLTANISLSSQTMTVVHRGKVIGRWPVSTARRGKVTPTGSWSASRAASHARAAAPWHLGQCRLRQEL